MGLPHYIHILEILWPDILVPNQRPSTSSLTKMFCLFQVASSENGAPLNVWCCIISFPIKVECLVYLLFLDTPKFVCIYIYSVYIYITWYPHYIRWSSHLWWAKIKAHSVSMAVRTSKDVAGGCWTAAGTRHCLEQLALLRYKDHQLSLPMKITNIHKQCVKPC